MKKSSMAKIKGISWNNSIFMRIMVTFIAILVPLYILGILIYNSAIQSVRKEISSSMISNITFYMDGLEKEIQRIRSLQYGLVSDVYLNRLAAIPEAMDNIEQTEALLILQNRLEAIRSSSQYISNVTTFIPSIDRAVTDRHVDVMDVKQYENLSGSCNPSTIVYLDAVPEMLMASPYMDNNTDLPMYILDIELDKQAFKEVLYQFDKYPGSGSLLMETASKKDIARANMDTDIEAQIINLLQGSQQGTFKVKKNNGTAADMYIFTSSDMLGMTLAMYVPEEVIFSPIRQYKKWFWIFTLAAVAVIGMFSFSMYRFIHKPLMKLVTAFKRVEEGNLQIAIEHKYNDEFRYMYRRFNAMVENLGNLIEQVYTMRILTQKAELKQLQSQINPHFLYNSFFILHRRIKRGDYENAITFSKLLGDYFRFITRNANDEVLLEREVEHARIYADIQKSRFSSRISVDFGELSEEYRNFMVPRLILQPIVENAFEHGLENKVSDGLLHIGFERKDSYISIIVEDNGENLEDVDLKHLQSMLADRDSQGESTGIINIHRRLQLKFGGQSGLSVLRSALGGFRVEIHISVSGGERYV